MSRLAAKPGRTARPGVQINYVKLRTLRRGPISTRHRAILVAVALLAWLPYRSQPDLLVGSDNLVDANTLPAQGGPDQPEISQKTLGPNILRIDLGEPN